MVFTKITYIFLVICLQLHFIDVSGFVICQIMLSMCIGKECTFFIVVFNC